MIGNIHGYNFCFLDILGFRNKITKENGLEEIKYKYLKLIEKVKTINDRYNGLYKIPGIYESVYWEGGKREKEVMIFDKINTIYGSDSILIWTKRTWEEYEYRNDSKNIHIADKWIAHPRPCDNFLNICNEIICTSIELELPLRGAITIGEGYFDDKEHIYLGKPIVEAYEFEGKQHIVGASFCESFKNQIIPKRYSLEFYNYLKGDGAILKRGNLLDWPRHWRKTRPDKDLKEAIHKIDFDGDPNKLDGVSIKKLNTIRFIEESEKFKDKFISKEETSIIQVYKEYYDGNYGYPILWVDADGNLKPDPDIAKQYNMRGISNYENKKQALKDFSSAIRIDPNLPEAYSNRGNVFCSFNKFESGIKDYNKAISINPNIAMYFFNRGIAYYHIGQFENAIFDFTQALRLEPTHYLAMQFRGIVLKTSNKIEESLQDLLTVVKNKPTYTAYHFLGEIYENLHFLEEDIDKKEEYLNLAKEYYYKAEEYKQIEAQTPH